MSSAPTPASGVPADRYGTASPSRSRRMVAILVIAVAAGCGLAWLVWAATYHANPPIRATLVGYEVSSEHAMSVKFDVAKDPERAAICVVRARGEDGAEVGRKEVTIPVGIGSTERVEALTTTARAVTGEIKDCRLAR